jgi:hypothetical protein
MADTTLQRYVNGKKAYGKIPNVIHNEEILVKPTMRYHCIPITVVQCKRLTKELLATLQNVTNSHLLLVRMQIALNTL